MADAYTTTQPYTGYPSGTSGSPANFDEIRNWLWNSSQNNLGTSQAPMSRNFQSYFNPILKPQTPTIDSMNPMNRSFRSDLTPMGPMDMSFRNDLTAMNPINRQFEGGNLFTQGQDLLAPAYGSEINPGTQRILDLIQQQGDVTRQKGVSDAQALAVRRGIGGSSVEQFGVQQAGAQAAQSTINAQTQTLLQNLELASQARNLAAQGYFGRASEQQSLGGQYSLNEFQTEAQRRQALAQLTQASSSQQYQTEAQRRQALAQLEASASGQEFGAEADRRKLLASLTSQNDLAYMSESAKQNALRASLEQNSASTEYQGQSDRDKLAAQIALQRGMTGAQLTSDELASIRNYQFGQQNLALQQQLGQQGIDVARQNIDASKEIANKQAQYGLYGALGSAILPSLLFGGGGGGSLFGGGSGGGGLLGNLFGGGGGTGGGSSGGGLFGGLGGLFGGNGAMTAQPYNPGFQPGSSQFPPSQYPGGIGAVGTGTAANAGLGGAFAGGVLPNLAAGLGGYSLGQNLFGTSKEGNIGGIAGGLGGSFFGPAGSAVGSFAGQAAGNAYGNLTDTQKAILLPFLDPKNTLQQIGSGAKKVAGEVGSGISKVTSAVSTGFKRIFGGGNTADGNAIADTSRGLQQQMGELQNLKAKYQAGEITKEQYLAEAQPAIDDSAKVVGQMASKGSTYATAVNRIWQDFMNAGLVANQNNQWVAV